MNVTRAALAATLLASSATLLLQAGPAAAQSPLESLRQNQQGNRAQPQPQQRGRVQIAGLSREEVSALHAAVAKMLTGHAAPPAPFDVFAVFDGVADHKTRHKCVLLPIEAVLQAFDASEFGEPGGKGS